MGRRKKEPESFHRRQIAAAAEKLFMQKGIAASTMDEIARQAGYSKATLYVYFTNKEDIVGSLILESMERLYEAIKKAVMVGGVTEQIYYDVCYALLHYQNTYPFYFELTIGKIKINQPVDDSTLDGKTYTVGEKINQLMVRLIQKGIKEGALRADIEPLPAIFLFWSSLSGFLLMTEAKQEYLEQTLEMSKQEYLDYGFRLLYQSIRKEGVTR